MKNINQFDFQEEILEGNFGSFNKIMVRVVSFDDFVMTNLCRLKVHLESQTLPDANGYWNIHGREHKIFYKKKLIAILHTEDCGLGSFKTQYYLEQVKGFKLA